MRKAKVAWLAEGFVGRKASGTARVAREIALSLNSFHAEEFQTILLTKKLQTQIELEEDQKFKGAEVIKLPTVRSKVLQSSLQFYFSRFNKKIKRLGIDYLIFSVPRFYPFYWIFPSANFICIFHAGGDITVKPEKFIFSRHAYNIIAKLQWRRLREIIAVSEIAANEISQNYKIPRDKIKVILPGADHLWEIPQEKYDFKLLESKKPFILVVGRWQRFKNIQNIVEGLLVDDSILKSHNILILAGSHNLLGENTKRIISKYPANTIECVEYVSDSQLKYLYNSAALVIHPSLNEGFGLPAFEAFGEGAKILVHLSTPAAHYLNGFSNVTIDDLSDIKNISNSISRSLKADKIDPKVGKDIILNLGATWNQNMNSYSRLFTINQE